MDMNRDRSAFTVLTLALASCQPASMPYVNIPDATPIAYADIQKGSGVLGYAESLLGPDIATKYDAVVGPGASLVEEDRVAGAWELPLATTTEKLLEQLRAAGSVDRIRDRKDGQILIADYQAAGQDALRLMLVNGQHGAFQTDAVPEVRPGPHVYLIAYRLK
jgi:hypothetical protein